MNNSKLYFDKEYFNDKVITLTGIDEAGRGALAGPVVVAGVQLNYEFLNPTLLQVDDSKKLSESKREYFFDIITDDTSIQYYISTIDNLVVDKINILQATLLGMKNCVENIQSNLYLIDGNIIPKTNKNCKSIVKGDGKSLAIACASILAKVSRDRLMTKLSEDYPDYKWAKNKAYATLEHRNAILKHGITPYHRLTFLSKLIDTPTIF